MSEATISTEEIRNILSKLCVTTYDSSFMGHTWKEAINEAVEKLKPFLKTEAQ